MSKNSYLQSQSQSQSHRRLRIAPGFRMEENTLSALELLGNHPGPCTDPQPHYIQLPLWVILKDLMGA